MAYQFFGMTPRAHQLEMIKQMLSNKRFYNLSDMGTGKTAATLWAVDMLLEARKINSVLIVCPVSIMKSVWVEEIKKILPNRTSSVVHGTRQQREKALAKPAEFYIINHDGVKWFLELLLPKNFDVIIIDEVDNFKHYHAAKKDKASKKITHTKTSAMKVLCGAARAVYGLTGTPMSNSPMDAFGVAKIVNPDNLPTQYITKWQQLTMYQVGGFTWVPNEMAAQHVFNTLQPAIRYKLEDCTDMPPIVYEHIEFELHPDQAKVYKEMYDHQVAEYKDGLITAMTAGVKMTKLMQISAGCVYDSEGNTVVLPLKGKIEEILHVQKQVGQVIVFCQFVEVAKMLHKELEDSALIYGDVSLNDRTKILADFEAGKFNILVAQPRTTAHGINLQFCNTIIFFGPILGNGFYRQAIARIRRTGQTKPQLVINFYSTPVEKRLYKVLEQKEIDSQVLLSMYESQN